MAEPKMFTDEDVAMVALTTYLDDWADATEADWKALEPGERDTYTAQARRVLERLTQLWAGRLLPAGQVTFSAANEGGTRRPLTDVEEEALAAFWTVVDEAANEIYPGLDGEGLERVDKRLTSAMQRGLNAAVEAVAALARADAAREARARASMAEDLRVVLDQRVMHAHSRPGVWDPDNRPGLANTRCVECAARERLQLWLAGPPADVPTDQPEEKP